MLYGLFFSQSYTILASEPLYLLFSFWDDITILPTKRSDVRLSTMLTNLFFFIGNSQKAKKPKPQ